MRTIITRYQKYQQINNLFNEYASLFEANAADLEAKNQFAAQLTETGLKISQLLLPLQPRFAVHQQSREALRSQLRLLAGRGMALAKNLADSQLYGEMQQLNTEAINASSFRLKALCPIVVAKLQNHTALLPTLGLSSEMLDSISEQATAFDAFLNETDSSYSQRKATRAQLNQLLSALHETLRVYLDSFVALQRSVSPEFYVRYRNLRRRKAHYRKRDVVKQPAEIFGVVKDQQSGEAIAQATVSLIEHSFVVLTDEDGSYTLEDLPAGTYTISCYAAGYKVPEVVTVEAGSDALLEVNFELQALAATA